MTGTQLTITLSGGHCSDAQAVLRTLEPIFGPPDSQPKDEHATVHTAVFGGTEGSAPTPEDTSGRTGVADPVTVTLQGTPEAVHKAGEALTAAFTVRDRGTVSGDQEQEREILIEA
ncbi:MULTISPECIES: hypothetical protein [Streptomyces]|jgi:hypothetical protein|uniref:Uncharacterized protein n=1 Tax=Streptomyces chilikensis TaxID=1194079 RepID=A0ABV3ETE8_9ACTN|nr:MULTISPECIES: hypothetical protein [Streptomyces]MDH6228583.1 hypothetical protein [Streptomyces sp. MJP52]